MDFALRGLMGSCRVYICSLFLLFVVYRVYLAFLVFNCLLERALGSTLFSVLYDLVNTVVGYCWV